MELFLSKNNKEISSNQCLIYILGILQMMPVYSKTFVFEDMNTLQPSFIRFDLPCQQYVNIKSVLKQICSDLSRKRFTIYNPETKGYDDIQQIKDINYQDETYIPWSYLSQDVIMVKYYEAEVSEQFEDHSQSQGSTIKKQRSKERTIMEVLNIVKQWRQMHVNQQTGQPNLAKKGKKLNLQQSAAMLGISKKSLDDYFYQLRLGQKYGFNFHDHLSDKIGVLRTFIKEKKPKGRKKDRNQKHPKNLQILDEIDGGEPFTFQRSKSKASSNKFINAEMEVQNQNSMKKRNSDMRNNNRNQDEFGLQRYDQQYDEMNHPYNPFKTQQVPKSIMDQFYTNFQIRFGQPDDPFVNLGNYEDDYFTKDLFNKKEAVFIGRAEQELKYELQLDSQFSEQQEYFFPN